MGMLDSLELGLDWLEKKQNASPDAHVVVETKAGTGRSIRYQVIDAIDSESGEQTWIVANVDGSERAICNSGELAEKIARALEAVS